MIIAEKCLHIYLVKSLNRFLSGYCETPRRLVDRSKWQGESKAADILPLEIWPLDTTSSSQSHSVLGRTRLRYVIQY